MDLGHGLANDAPLRRTRRTYCFCNVCISPGYRYRSVNVGFVRKSAVGNLNAFYGCPRRERKTDENVPFGVFAGKSTGFARTRTIRRRSAWNRRERNRFLVEIFIVWIRLASRTSGVRLQRTIRSSIEFQPSLENHVTRILIPFPPPLHT